MRVLVLGDFGGGRPSARPLRILKLDPDAPAMHRLGATADVAGGGAPLAIRSVDDFSPDVLVDLLEDARRLRAVRERLADGDADAAGELERLLERDAPPAATPPVASGAAQAPAGNVAAADLLASVLAETPSAPDDDSRIDDLVRAATESSLRRIRDTTGPERRKRLLEAADERLAAHVRSLLHAPRVRELEATWRGLDLLVRSTISTEETTLRVADLSRAELDEDVGVSGPLAGDLFRFLVDEAGETRRADVVVVAFPFDAVPRDVATLLRLARLADAGGFTLLADAGPGLAAGGPTGAAAELWKAFRRVPEARRVGLVRPRVLLRAPYGRAHRRTERFEFEEFGGGIDAARLLWGPAAFAVASILACSFAAQGGSWRVTGEPALEGLPAVTGTDEDGEPVLVPCAETRLGAREVQATSAAGLLPVLAASDAAAVRIVNLTSCAEPSAPLAAPPDGE